MSRAFLSHSTFDKDFVDKVFESLGSGRCVYDKATFRKNSDLALQIREGLEECDVYVLFLSAPALDSGWVNSEMDLANELKTQWKIRKFLVFQLDGTNWTKLPGWLGRYVLSCPPSPGHVALRLLDELRQKTEYENDCLGRSEDVQRIITELDEHDVTPSYLYLSGPVGIGRRTLGTAVFNTYYKDINNNKIQLTMEQVEGTSDLYRKALTYSGNWRAGDLKRQTDKFGELSAINKTKSLANLLYDISVTFRQVVVINLGVAGLNDEGRPQSWFVELIKELKLSDYPYIWFISQRFLEGFDLPNGLFYAVQPLNEKWSSTLFKVLIKKHKITLPSKEEQRMIEGSISGHPGLITIVANYLRKNPRYKPNRTHNNIVKLINSEVQQILSDFLASNVEREKAVALYSEAHILSYEEVKLVSENWSAFETSTEELLDAGLFATSGADYFLVSYIQRAASAFATKHKKALAEARRILLTAFDNLSEDTFVSMQLLDSRIIAHIVDGAPFNSYLSNLIMPSQQIKAAKRKYDMQNYDLSLSLAKSAYQQAAKLSDNGQREAWRLIGLSSIKGDFPDSFEYFESEYKKLPNTPQVMSSYYFAKGLKARINGNFRWALTWYEKIDKNKFADFHVYRELAYIYAFERSFDRAHECVNRALDLAFGNPFVLDVLAMVLLERYKSDRNAGLIRDIQSCLDDLKIADAREETTFYYSRSKMRDVIINNEISPLNELFSNRRRLPISAKTALLSILSLKGKDYQYDELYRELVKTVRDKNNHVARIEIRRIDFEHQAYRENYKQARRILVSLKEFVTDKCFNDMNRLLPR